MSTRIGWRVSIAAVAGRGNQPISLHHSCDHLAVSALPHRPDIGRTTCVHSLNVREAPQRCFQQSSGHAKKQHSSQVTVGVEE